MPTKTARRLTTAPDALTKLLAPAEAEVMRLLWSHGPLKMQPIYQHLAAQRDVAYLSVKTAADRLVEKGLLRREKAQRGFGWVYRPTIGEHAFIADQLADILTAMEQDYPVAVAECLKKRGPA